jgi:hypothetical protein
MRPAPRFLPLRIEEILKASGERAMSCKDRVGGPVGAVRPFVPTQGHDDPRDDIAEALDHIARAIAAIDHNVQALIAKLDNDSAAVARLAASLEAKSR